MDKIRQKLKKKAEDKRNEEILAKSKSGSGSEQVERETIIIIASKEPIKAKSIKPKIAQPYDRTEAIKKFDLKSPFSIESDNTALV